MTKPHYRRTADGGTIMVNDGLTNLISGLGTDRDKGAGAFYGVSLSLSNQEITSAYRDAPLAKKIVNIPAIDAVREWREWQAGAKQISMIEAEEKRLNLQAMVAKAKKWARLRGYAALYIGTGDNDASQPLRVDRIRKGGIRFLAPLSRLHLTPGDLQLDPEQPGFNEPAFYTLATAGSSGVEIHPSRLAIFCGEDVPDDEQHYAAQGMGDSVLQSTLRAVSDTDAAFGNVLSLIYEAKVDVVKIPNFTENLKVAGAEYEKTMIRRWALAMRSKGINGSLLLDAEEEYDQKSANFSTLDSLLDKFMTRVAAAADIPATRLWGISPGGLNSTGEGDLRNYYDRIKTEQTLEIGPSMNLLDEALIRSALGSRPDEIHYNWRPLWQPTEKEQAEVADKITTAFEKVHRMDLLPEEAVGKALVNALTESGIAPGLEADVAEFYSDMDGEDTEPNVLEIADAAPKTLYVHRKVLNAEEIIAWAKEQGFKTTLPADDLHVTVAFSRKAVDWMKMGESWSSEVEVGAGGARMLERFGDARVLLFNSSELSWRHEEMKRGGATWDHPEYQPHITISYAEDAPDLADVEPYQGKISLGPEIFQEVKADWAEAIKEV